MNTITMGEDIGTKINQNFNLNSNNFKLMNTTKEYGIKGNTFHGFSCNLGKSGKVI